MLSYLGGDVLVCFMRNAVKFLYVIYLKQSFTFYICCRRSLFPILIKALLFENCSGLTLKVSGVTLSVCASVRPYGTSLSIEHSIFIFLAQILRDDFRMTRRALSNHSDSESTQKALRAIRGKGSNQTLSYRRSL